MKPKELIDAAIAHLRTEHLAVKPRHPDIPRLRERRQRRQLRVRAQRLLVPPVPAVHRRTHRGRVVAHRPLLRDADARNRREGHRARAAEKLRLLVVRHLRQGRLRRREGLVVLEHRLRPGRRYTAPPLTSPCSVVCQSYRKMISEGK